MRRSLILAAAGLVVVAGAIGLAVAGGGDNDPTLEPAPSGLDTLTVTAGEVDVRIEPHQLDAEGAVFTVSLDTHSVELDADLTLATLEVGTTTWPGEGWTGDGPSGHHREGQLRFRAASAATGTATLRIPGLPEPVEASWQLDR